MSMDRDPNVYDRETRVYDRDTRGSNTLVYLIGGLVIALGLLAFLFYDGGRDVSTTSGVGTTDRPAASSTSPSTPAPANRPAAPSSPAPAPANPAPSNPAPQ